MKKIPIYLPCNGGRNILVVLGRLEGDQTRNRLKQKSLLGPLRTGLLLPTGLSVRSEYRPHFCQTCHRLHPSSGFHLNFDDSAYTPKNLKPGAYHSVDNFFVFHEAFVGLVAEKQIQGMQFKRIGSKPWYVGYCNVQTPFDPDFLKRLRHEHCSDCGYDFLHHAGDTGAIRFFDYLKLPENPLTFCDSGIYRFSHIYGEPEYQYGYQEIFFQMELAKLLREELKLRKLKFPSWGVY